MGYRESEPAEHRTTCGGKRDCNRRTGDVPIWARIGWPILFMFGVLGLVYAVIIPQVTQFASLLPAQWELPMGRLDNIAVDPQGNIYCHSRGSEWLQVYGPEGRFIRKFFYDGGAFTIDENQNIRGDYGQEIRTFDIEGNLLKQEPYLEMHSKEFRDALNGRAEDAFGNRYRIMPFSRIITRVEKIDPQGAGTVIVSQPLHIWLFQSAFHFSLLYLLLLFCFRWTYMWVEHSSEKR